MYKTTVILPLYNESATIKRTLGALKPYAAFQPETCFLFVNDGSTDNTAEIITEFIKDLPNVSLLNLKPNRGKAEALKLAVREVNTDYIIFTDGDLAYSLEHIDKISNALKNNEVAIGNRKLGENSKRKVQRLIAGEAFNRLARLLLNLDYTDTQAGLKGFRANEAKKLFSLSRISDFAFDAELLYIARLKGYRVAQIPAKVDRNHEYSPSTIKVVRDSPGMFLSLIKMILFRVRGKYDE